MLKGHCILSQGIWTMDFWQEHQLSSEFEVRLESNCCIALSFPRGQRAIGLSHQHWQLFHHSHHLQCLEWVWCLWSYFRLSWFCSASRRWEEDHSKLETQCLASLKSIAWNLNMFWNQESLMNQLLSIWKVGNLCRMFLSWRSNWLTIRESCDQNHYQFYHRK